MEVDKNEQVFSDSSVQTNEMLHRHPGINTSGIRRLDHLTNQLADMIGVTGAAARRMQHFPRVSAESL